MHEEEDFSLELAAEEAVLAGTPAPSDDTARCDAIQRIASVRHTAGGVGGVVSANEELMLARYLDGSLSSADRDAIHEQLVHRAEMRAALMALRADLYAITSSLPNEETVAAHLKQEIVQFTLDDKISTPVTGGEVVDTQAITLQEFTKMRAAGGRRMRQ